MFKINTNITWRTNGRGVTRILKGTIRDIVPEGKLPSKDMQVTLPHGGERSNRDRYIVALDKTGKLVWANCKTCVESGEKVIKPATKRIAKKVKTAKIAKKVKTKRIAKKVKTKRIAKKVKTKRIVRKSPKPASVENKVEAKEDAPLPQISVPEEHVPSNEPTPESAPALPQASVG